jgi:hypothetical protein
MRLSRYTDGEPAGVLYIAFGKRFINEAFASAKNVKLHSNVSTALFCDREVGNALFDYTERINPEHKRAKVDVLGSSPFKKTLYLDADTVVLRDISEIFILLDRFDVVGTHDYSRKKAEWAKKICEYDEIPYAFPEINGGVLGFKTNAQESKFLDLWRKKFWEYRKCTRGMDQPALRMAAWESGANLYILPTEFNVRNQTIRRKIRSRMKEADSLDLLRPRILHFHGCQERKRIWNFSSKYRAMKII